jgi:hypothetical protein
MAEAASLEWHHLPIPDMGEPGWHFERRWIYSGARLRRLLRRGGRVVVHCRAGLGRAGTIAARLLVELGMPPAEAISQVRKARPGAIQTPNRNIMFMPRAGFRPARMKPCPGGWPACSAAPWGTPSVTRSPSKTSPRSRNATAPRPAGAGVPQEPVAGFR